MKERRRERERQKERMFSMLINRTFDLVSRNKNLVKPRYQLDKPTHESSFFFPFFFLFSNELKIEIEELRVYARVYFERQDRE